MDQSKRSERANNIRQLILNDQVAKAITQITKWAKTRDKDRWDEAVTLSANWTRLLNDERRNISTAEQLDRRRNQLIDQALDLTTSLEMEQPADSTAADTGDMTISKTLTVNKPTNRLRDILLLSFGLVVLVGVSLYFLANAINKEDDAIPYCEALLLLKIEDSEEAETLTDLLDIRTEVVNHFDDCPSVFDADKRKKTLEKIDSRIAALSNEASVEAVDEETIDGPEGQETQPKSPDITLSPSDRPVFDGSRLTNMDDISKALTERQPVAVLKNIEGMRKQQTGNLSPILERRIKKKKQEAIDMIKEGVKKAIASNSKKQILDMGDQLSKLNPEKDGIDPKVKAAWETQLKKAYITAK